MQQENAKLNGKMKKLRQTISDQEDTLIRISDLLKQTLKGTTAAGLQPNNENTLTSLQEAFETPKSTEESEQLAFVELIPLEI